MMEFAMAIHRDRVTKCFKHELDTSQIMNIQSGFYSQTRNLSAIAMRRTAHLMKQSGLSISKPGFQASKNVSIMKHWLCFRLINTRFLGFLTGKNIR
jgi:hypothetical protein